MPSHSVILNFHGVGPILRDIDRGEQECWLEQDHFEAVLDLASNQPNVRVTVDDGNSSDFSIILPALLKRSLRATFFICSGRLNHSTFLNQTQISELIAHGMNIGSHGINHVAWSKLTDAQLSNETLGSRKELQEIFKIPIDQAACPFGDYNGRVLRYLRRADYRFVHTSDEGCTNLENWIQARVTVTRSMPLSSIQQLVEYGPNSWSQTLTDIRKFFKRIR